MFIAMLLAHLVGDYVLQWDSLAVWKSKALKGALAHGALVTVVTFLFAWIFDPAWWPWALFIGATHTSVDALWLLNRRLPPKVQLNPLTRFVLDQAVHFSFIVMALVLSGYAAMPLLPTKMLSEMQSYRTLAYVIGYVFITMPAWVVVEFMVYGLVRAPAPDFSPSANKYVGILERGLITTFVLLGQYGLVPLVALPRLMFDGPRMIGSQRSTPYVAEVLASITLAVAIGLGLRILAGR
ncbi:MAG TPA: DUF3307 domain-containing protein [Anaerolineales bacterium]|nr:DUF3307 domain-containing protein [Anaerolineales bacterium]